MKAMDIIDTGENERLCPECENPVRLIGMYFRDNKPNANGDIPYLTMYEAAEYPFLPYSYLAWKLTNEELRERRKLYRIWPLLPTEKQHQYRLTDRLGSIEDSKEYLPPELWVKG